jgi:hypothetical protein
LEPYRVYLAVYRTLVALSDGGAMKALEIANRQIQEQARNIQQPAQRKSFLERNPAIRELILAGQSATR